MIRMFVLVLSILPVLGTDNRVDNDGASPAARMRFEIDLRFGNADDDHFLWTDPNTNIAIDETGRIYVADIGESRILRFTPDGSFDEVIARKGPGPGELVSLSSFQILADGSGVAIEDLRMAVPRFHLFDAAMAYIRTITPEGTYKYHTGVRFAPDGKHFAASTKSFDMERGNERTNTALFTVDSKPVRIFSESSLNMQMHRFREPAYLASYLGDSLAEAYQPRGVYCFDATGRMYVASTTEYAIDIWDPSLERVERVVTCSAKPKVNTPELARGDLDLIADRFRGFQAISDIMTDNFLDRIVADTEISPARPFVWGLIPTPSGGFLVIHTLDSRTGAQRAHAFDATGELTAHAALPDWAFLNRGQVPRMIFRDDHAYTVLTDEYGENRVVRYRVTYEE